MTRWFLYSWPPRFQHEPNLPGFTPQHCHISYDLFTHFLLKGSISSRMCIHLCPANMLLDASGTQMFASEMVTDSDLYLSDLMVVKVLTGDTGKIEIRGYGILPAFQFHPPSISDQWSGVWIAKRFLSKNSYLNIYECSPKHQQIVFPEDTHYYYIWLLLCGIDIIVVWYNGMYPPPPFCIPCHFIMQFMPCRVLYKPPGSIMSFDFFLS